MCGGQCSSDAGEGGDAEAGEWRRRCARGCGCGRGTKMRAGQQDTGERAGSIYTRAVREASFARLLTRSDSCVSSRELELKVGSWSRRRSLAPAPTLPGLAPVSALPGGWAPAPVSASGGRRPRSSTLIRARRLQASTFNLRSPSAALPVLSSASSFERRLSDPERRPSNANASSGPASRSQV